MLTIYNTLTKEKAPFKPIEANKVRMYVCGMTVYDYCHVGHARVMVVFDMVARWLRALEYDVTYIRNITDIDDKIINRANENGEDIYSLTERFIQAMYEDADALGVLRPDHEPRATQYIEHIIDLTQRLITQGYAYTANNGDVYYAVNKFANYGKLSGKRIEDLRAGERVDIDEAKQDPLDFVLWKAAKVNEPSWDSPWGKGRPGWHIECSAMSTHCLGNHFDIHGGGMDLQFPHHENEIAQSEGATGEQFVNVWMHNGFVRVNEEKMSKSLGNFFTLRDVLKKYPAEVIRYFILNSHYRSPLNYSDQQLDAAHQALTRLYTALRGFSGTGAILDKNDAFYHRFATAMNDDFNTAEAVAVLFELTREINRLRTEDMEQATQLAQQLKQLGGVLGILQADPETWFKGAVSDGLSNEAVENLIAERQAVRQAKNWAESDRIRDVLKAEGIILEDAAGITTWRRGA
ncbi:cysteine--tRNA ligase [Beggiatoa leptomitoformis]|uniref:Cysteine--tRNA ligase n=1 Tax=Beggiatoa leptomitoformis TaxID=288004 RepID=A0A2N9YAS3_9GAMM|nr:cysteine--tRNA ligase [Beggiatoa leptomitoformis]ALG67052.1 cysteine--tRNA ligase [Beggiatoa leptomitoformis]AUI67565.1 cysteine--tRNA ligase [Beggiatoa leptomitoformis]